MDLENYVVSELEKRNYPIFYRNLLIYSNRPTKRLVTEFDIISNDFIIEVKSGNDVCNIRCNQINNQVSLLPEGYKLYYFCPELDNSCIENNNKNFSSLSNLITYINDLNVIYNNHKPINQVNIKTQKDFTKFLFYSIDKLKVFTKICTKDHYNSPDKDRIYISQKIKYLVDNNIIHIVDEFDNKIPYFVKIPPINKIYIKDVTNIKPIKIPLYYI